MDCESLQDGRQRQGKDRRGDRAKDPNEHGTLRGFDKSFTPRPAVNATIGPSLSRGTS
jgi:hypothetical protein